MKCENCGKEVKENWKICPWCKFSLKKIVKKCPNCGEKVDDSWDICPVCEYPLQVFDNNHASNVLPNVNDMLQNESNLDLEGVDIVEHKQYDDKYQRKLSLARLACIQGQYSQAQQIYDELAKDNSMDINAYIGYVRIKSQNYTLYQGSNIELMMQAVEIIGFIEGDGNLDKEYLEYLSKRNSELAKIDADKELKLKEISNNFNIKNSLLVKYKGKGGDVIIPDCVTSIGKYAFSGCTGITSITIPNSVTKIGFSAFDGCRSLKNLTIPDSVTAICSHAFSGCKGLASIIIPNSVTYIGNGAFKKCSSIRSVHVSKNCKIDEGAFDSTCEVIRR